MRNRCDQVSDCRDESDESGCQILVLKKNYRKSSPPVLSVRRKDIRTIFPANVTVSLTLLDVVAVRERENEIDIKFMAKFEWFELRAVYHNLKDKKTQNSLELEDAGRLWIPKLIFQNNKNNDDTLAELERSHIYVKKKGVATQSKITSIDEIEIFEGKENPLTMIQSYTKDFKCVYDMRAFPFDTQVGEKIQKNPVGFHLAQCTGLLHQHYCQRC